MFVDGTLSETFFETINIFLVINLKIKKIFENVVAETKNF